MISFDIHYIFNFKFVISSPEKIFIDKEAIDLSNNNGGQVEIIHDPDEAAFQADCVLTDVWVSMGDKTNQDISDSIISPSIILFFKLFSNLSISS